MPYYIVQKCTGPLTEREAADLIEREDADVTLIIGEVVPFEVTTIRRVSITQPRNLALPFEVVTAADHQHTPPKSSKAKGVRGKYGEPVPAQVLAYLQRNPGDHSPSDIAAELGLPRHNVTAAVSKLRSRHMVTGERRVTAVTNGHADV